MSKIHLCITIFYIFFTEISMVSLSNNCSFQADYSRIECPHKVQKEWIQIIYAESQDSPSNYDFSSLNDEYHSSFYALLETQVFPLSIYDLEENKSYIVCIDDETIPCFGAFIPRNDLKGAVQNLAVKIRTKKKIIIAWDLHLASSSYRITARCPNYRDPRLIDLEIGSGFPEIPESLKIEDNKRPYLSCNLDEFVSETEIKLNIDKTSNQTIDVCVCLETKSKDCDSCISVNGDIPDALLRNITVENGQLIIEGKEASEAEWHTVNFTCYYEDRSYCLACPSPVETNSRTINISHEHPPMTASLYYKNKPIARTELISANIKEEMNVIVIAEVNNLQFIWKRGALPWAPTSVNVACNGTRETSFKEDMYGCEIHLMIDRLRPFTLYECIVQCSVEGKILKKSILQKTKAGACPRVQSLKFLSQPFNENRMLHPTFSWKIAPKQTGIISNFTVTLEKDREKSNSVEIKTCRNSSFENPCLDYCFYDGICQAEFTGLGISPNTTYKVIFGCYNAGSEAFHSSTLEITTDDAIPKANKSILGYVDSLTVEDNTYTQMSLTVNHKNIDDEAGFISRLEAIYAVKGFLSPPTSGKSHNRSKRDGSYQQEKTVEVGIDKERFILDGLSPSTWYSVKLRMYTSAGYGDSEFLYFQTSDSPFNFTIYEILMLILYVILLLLAFLLNKNYRYDRRSVNIDNRVVIGDGHLINLVECANKPTHFIKDKALSEQFLNLAKISPIRPWQDSFHPINMKQNRYNNIRPFDFSRVVLKEEPGRPCADYINASFLHGYKDSYKFIASQGPFHSTVGQFWKMVWEKDIQIIVMLTKCIENRMEKCEMYWPPCSNEMTIFQDAHEHRFIERIEETVKEKEGYIIRRFKITSKIRYLALTHSKIKEVTQYHFIAWPDMQCPLKPSQLLNFIHVVREATPPDYTHILVHCSAGVGRTGTYITLDALIDQIQMDGKEEIDIFNHVLKMRHYRTNMVQTLAQYVFIHESALLIYFSKGVKGNLNELEKVESKFPCLIRRQTSQTSNFSSFPEGEDLIRHSDSEEEDPTNNVHEQLLT